VKEQEVQIENGKISQYKVIIKITFVLDESQERDQGWAVGVNLFPMLRTL